MYKAPQKRDFFEGLALVSISKADVIRKRTDSKALDVDVEVIDLEDPTFDQAPTPSKSPRPIFCRRESIIIKQETPDIDDRTHLNGSRSDTGNDIKYHPRKSVSLLSIDVTSVLGQRVKKHVKLPGVNCDMGDVFDDLPPYEKFCRTPVKNGIVRQLRHRDDGFPVTFRKSKRVLPLSTHSYTFTCRQRLENYRRLMTGLTARARALKRSMRECRVVVQRMTATQIRRWTQRPASTLKVRLSPLTPGEIACWLTGEKGPSYMFPNIHDGSLPSSHVLRGLLGQNAAPAPLSHRRRLTLSPVASKDVNVELLRQKAMVFRNLLSGIDTGSGDGRNTIDLTTPASSKDGATNATARKGHDLRKEPLRKATFGDGLPIAPNENRRPKQSPEIRMSHTTDSFYNSGKIGRNGRQAEALQTRPENAMAGDSVLRRQLLLRNSDEPVASASTIPHSTRNTTNGNVAKTSPIQTKRCLVWDGQTSGAPEPNLNRRHSAAATSLPHARKASSSHVDDVVMISDDESAPTEDVPVVRGNRRSSAVGRDGPVAKRRKSGQASSPDMLFNCHMCGEAITFNADMQTYITQHFAARHGVPNVRLVQKVGNDGRKVVTIVEGPQCPPQPMSSGRLTSRPMANVPPQRRDLVNKIATHRTSQPPLITSAPTRRLTRLNSVPDSGMTTRAGTTVARPVRDRHSAPIVDYICID